MSINKALFVTEYLAQGIEIIHSLKIDTNTQFRATPRMSLKTSPERITDHCNENLARDISQQTICTKVQRFKI